VHLVQQVAEVVIAGGFVPEFAKPRFKLVLVHLLLPVERLLVVIPDPWSAGGGSRAGAEDALFGLQTPSPRRSSHALTMR
jgi:hypothetical protein